MIAEQAKHEGVRPVWIALAIAVLGVVGMLLVDHGPWTRAHPQDAHVALYHTTGEAARAAGARVVPTAPKSAVEPQPEVPKQVEPPNPEPN
jgi:hypothetical protein